MKKYENSSVSPRQHIYNSAVSGQDRENSSVSGWKLFSLRSNQWDCRLMRIVDEKTLQSQVENVESQLKNVKSQDSRNKNLLSQRLKCALSRDSTLIMYESHYKKIISRWIRTPQVPNHNYMGHTNHERSLPPLSCRRLRCTESSVR